MDNPFKRIRENEISDDFKPITENEKFIANALDLIQNAEESNCAIDGIILNQCVKLKNEDKKEIKHMVSAELVELNVLLLRRNRLLKLESFLGELTRSQTPPRNQSTPPLERSDSDVKLPDVTTASTSYIKFW